MERPGLSNHFYQTLNHRIKVVRPHTGTYWQAMIDLHRLAIYKLHRIATLLTPTRQEPLDPPASAMRIKGLLRSAAWNSHSFDLHKRLSVSPPATALMLRHDLQS